MNKDFEDHIKELEKLALEGDEMSIKSLACMAILKEQNELA
jgi:hypothetical protein